MNLAASRPSGSAVVSLAIVFYLALGILYVPGYWTAPVLVLGVFVGSTLLLIYARRDRPNRWVAGSAALAAGAGAGVSALVNWAIFWSEVNKRRPAGGGGMGVNLVECWACPSVVGTVRTALVWATIAGVVAWGMVSIYERAQRTRRRIADPRAG